jgi:hypothetical protein
MKGGDEGIEQRVACSPSPQQATTSSSITSNQTQRRTRLRGGDLAVAAMPRFPSDQPRRMSHLVFRGTKSRAQNNHHMCWDQVSHI